MPDSARSKEPRYDPARWRAMVERASPASGLPAVGSHVSMVRAVAQCFSLRWAGEQRGLPTSPASYDGQESAAPPSQGSPKTGGYPKTLGKNVGAQACPFDQLIHRQAQDDPERGRRVRAPSPSRGCAHFGGRDLPSPGYGKARQDRAPTHTRRNHASTGFSDSFWSESTSAPIRAIRGGNEKWLCFPGAISAAWGRMDATSQEVLDIFTRTQALLRGHFVLRSGLHSAHYFQCAQVCQHLAEVERLAQLLLAKLSGVAFQTVLSPAMGGLVIGQEVARQARARFLFAEKEANGLGLRRGFQIAAGEPVLVVEDVVTRGGRVVECLDLIRRAGGVPAGIAMLVDRSAGAVTFDAPVFSLLEMSFPTYPPDQVPEWLAKLPVEKPGS